MSIMSAERATFEPSWSSTELQSKVKMRTNLSEEQFSEWEGLKRRHSQLQQVWMANIKNNKQRLNTMKREDALVQVVRRLQEFSQVVHEHITECKRQSEAEKAEARVQTEVFNQAKRLAWEKVELQVQARYEEREAKRLITHKEKEE